MQNFLKAVAQSLCNLGLRAISDMEAVYVDGCRYEGWERGKGSISFDYQDRIKMNSAGVQTCVLHVVASLAEKRKEAARHEAARLLMQGASKHKNIRVYPSGAGYEATIRHDDVELMASILEAVMRVLDVHQLQQQDTEVDWRPDSTIPEDSYAV